MIFIQNETIFSYFSLTFICINKSFSFKLKWEKVKIKKLGSPVVAFHHSFAPLWEVFTPLFFGHFRLPDRGHFVQILFVISIFLRNYRSKLVKNFHRITIIRTKEYLDVIDRLPITSPKSSCKGGAKSGCLSDALSMQRYTQHISLELHQKIVVRDASVHFEGRKLNTLQIIESNYYVTQTNKRLQSHKIAKLLIELKTIFQWVSYFIWKISICILYVCRVL